jgi:AcrR family transcriptional regulator
MCPKVTAEHKTEIKERIVHAAIEVFAKYGFDRARMDDIAITAELSKGTLYLYFKNKEDLFFAICEYNIEALKEQLSALFKKKENLLSDAEKFYENFRKIARNTDHQIVMFEMMAESSRNDKLRKALHQNKIRIYQTVKDSLNNQIRDGILRNDIDVDALAAGLVALYDGLTLSRIIGINDLHNKKAWTETIKAIIVGIS